MSKISRRYANISFPVLLPKGIEKKNVAEALRPFMELLGLGTQEFSFELHHLDFEISGSPYHQVFLQFASERCIKCYVTVRVPIRGTCLYNIQHELVNYLEDFCDIELHNQHI